jgi:hypothetical protein
MFHPLMYKECQKLINSTCMSCTGRAFKASRARAKMCLRCNTVNHGDYVIYASNMMVAVRASDPEHTIIHASSVPEGALPEGYITSRVLVPPIYLRTPEGVEWPTEIQRLYERLAAAVRAHASVCGACRAAGAPGIEGATSTMPAEGSAFRQLMTGERVEPPEGTEWPTEIRRLYDQLAAAVRGIFKQLMMGKKRKKIELPEGIEWPTWTRRLYDQLLYAVCAQTDVCIAYCKTTGALRNEGTTGVMSGKGGVFRQLMMGKRVELSARAVVVGDPSLALDQVSVPKAVADQVKIGVSCTEHNAGRLKYMASSGLLWWEGTNDAVCPANILRGMSFSRRLEDGDLTMLNRQPSLSRASLVCFRVVIRRDDERVFAINPQITPPFNADFDGDEMNIFFMPDKAEMMELCSVLECARPLQPVQDVVTGCYLMSDKNAPVSDSVWGDCVAYAGGQHTPERTTHGLLSMCIQGYDGGRLYKSSFKHLHADVYLLQLVVERWMSARGLTVPLRSLIARPVVRGNSETTDSFKERCIMRVREDMSGTGIMDMIDSGAKGSVVHASHMAVAIGQQYIGGKEGVFCSTPYSRGLGPDEFFGHQMAAREGVVSTGISTASTGYLNRRACKTTADLRLQYNGTVADQDRVSSFRI